MCGIAAIFAYAWRAPSVDRAQLDRVCRRMAPRGPDSDGIWIATDERVALGHRRLSIIDLSARGSQPMQSADGRYVISFNGEIYNYQALRRTLEDRGHVFHTSSDTEVLLALYAAKGERMLTDLRGMFAFAIWDTRRRGMFLARDMFGVKPLYYSDDGATLRAASEVKALLAGGSVDTEPEPAGHVGFFLWGSVPEPYTMFRGIRALPAGHRLWISDSGERELRSFADVNELFQMPEMRSPIRLERDARGELREALIDSVRHHLVADVDVGVFLSAGLDSTTLAALASESGENVRSVTLGFVEYRGTEQDEVPLAEFVARTYGLDHKTIWITRQDFENERAHLLDRMDQPSTDGVNTYFVSRAASQAGLKVALSGLGGDELFGGYPSFSQVPRLVSLAQVVPAAESIGRHVRTMLAPTLGVFTSQKYAGLLEYGGDFGGAYLLRRGLFMPWELTRVLDPDIAHSGLTELAPRTTLSAIAREIPDNRQKVSVLEATSYMRNQLLRDTDWASMTWSLEVRVPLVDPGVWRRVGSLMSAGFRLTKRTMASCARTPLPDVVLERAKTGFSIPTNRWLGDRNAPAGVSRGLRGWARNVYHSYTGTVPT